MAEVPIFIAMTLGSPNEACPCPSQTIFLVSYGVDCSCGAFVLLPYGGQSEVFRLLRRSTEEHNRGRFLCQHFPRLFSPEYASLPVEKIADPPTSHLVELFASDRGYFIDKNYIHHNATTVFVFRPKDVSESGYHWCRGASIAFVVRYYIATSIGSNQPRAITPIDNENWRHLTSFPSCLSGCKFSTCFPFRVWIAVGFIHETVAKVMN